MTRVIRVSMIRVPESFAVEHYTARKMVQAVQGLFSIPVFFDLSDATFLLINREVAVSLSHISDFIVPWQYIYVVPD